MDVWPALAVRPDLYERDIEGAVLRADAGEAVEVAGIPGVEDPPRGAGDHPGAPERRVADQAATGEVPGGGEDEPDAGDRGVLGPVQLDDPVLRHTPAFQVGAHTQRNEEWRLAGFVERLDRRLVEVVVVIMGDDHSVDGRQVGHGHGWFVQAARPDVLGRRTPFAPDRVDQDPA